EYPISSDDAARQVIASLGMKKVRATRIDALWQVVDRGRVRVDDRDFLWPVSVANDEFTGYRADVLRRVPIDQLHPQELRNAMTAAMSRSRGADQETLMRETLALLGAGRMTEGVRSVLVRTYQDTTSHGPLRSAAPSIGARAPKSKEPTVVQTAGREPGVRGPQGPGDSEVATPKRRGRPRIDPAAELQEILDLRDRGLAAKHAGDDDALSILEDVTERLTKRMTRLRKWGREGEESAAHDAARSQKLRGEVFGEMVEILTRTDRADDAMYFLGRAANDHHRPSMVELARRLESEGHLG